MEGVQRVRYRAPVWLVFRGATRTSQTALQLPTEFQGQHTDKDMAAGAGVLADKDGAHLQQARLQHANVLFDLRQGLIAIMGGLRIEYLSRDIGLQDITAGQLQELLVSGCINGECDLTLIEGQRHDRPELVAL